MIFGFSSGTAFLPVLEESIPPILEYELFVGSILIYYTTYCWVHVAYYMWKADDWNGTTEQQFLFSFTERFWGTRQSTAGQSTNREYQSGYV
jgi:hypothetical protein